MTAAERAQHCFFSHKLDHPVCEVRIVAIIYKQNQGPRSVSGFGVWDKDVMEPLFAQEAI